MARKRKRDIVAELAALRSQLTQDSADNVARMARLQADLHAAMG